MGTRYDLELTVNLKEDVPDDVVRMVAFLLLPNNDPPATAPDDPFFGYAWREEPFVSLATTLDPNAGDAISSFRSVYRYTQHEIEHYQHTLHLRFAAKLETIAEVGLSFAMWIAQWSDQNECVGYYKGEDSRHPTLLYFHDGELYLREVSEPPQRATDGVRWE